MTEEGRASAAAWQAAFGERHKKWIEEALAFAGRGVGFPRGRRKGSWLPMQGQKHQEVVGDASPEKTLKKVRPIWHPPARQHKC